MVDFSTELPLNSKGWPGPVTIRLAMIDTIKAIPELKGQDAVLKKIDDIAKLWEDKMLLTAYNIIKDRVHDLELHRPFHGYSCIFRHPKKVGYLELSI